jgi:CHAT domain-containing protein
MRCSRYITFRPPGIKKTWKRGLPLIGAFVCLSACVAHKDPHTVLDHAQGTFQRGYLNAAADEAKNGFNEFHGQGADWAWRFRLLEANALTWKGRSDCVLPLLLAEPVPSSHQGCDFDSGISKLPPPPPGELAVEKARLEGWTYVVLHKFPEAEQKLADADRMCAEFAPSSCANVVRARGRLEMGLGNFARAQQLFENTLGSARERGDRFLEATALLNLGWSALRQEHFDEAMDWSQKTRQLAITIDAEYLVQTAAGNLGWAYYRLGDLDKALPLLKDAEDLARKIGAETSEIAWLTDAGYVYLDGHQYRGAEGSYSRALNLAQGIESQDDVVNALMSLALVSERTGKLDQARDYADKTIALVPKDGNRLDILYPMLVKGHVAARQHDSQQAERIYREIERDPKSHVFLKWEAEHSLAQLYEDENQPDAADHEYRAALNTFEGARAALHEDTSLPFPANAASIYDDYVRFLVNQGKTNEALQVAEYQRGRTLAEGLGVLQKGGTFKPDDPKAQATAHKVGGTILFYWLGEKQSYLWAITAQKTALFSLSPKSEIEPIAQRYRKALVDQQERLSGTNDDGLALYHKLVEPAASEIPKNAKVFIIPDGTLNTLNFETLLVPASTPHYWIEDATITDASSLHLLAASRTKAKRNENVLLFGNAVAPNPDYPELRKAAAEMESIEKHFQPIQQQVFAREQATPAAYLASKAEQYSYIHFVAHGTASRMSPLDSAIVLSRSNAQEDSFKLYARDIIHHPLRAQLVTISTCYGAGARAYSGEGLVGLSWAFLRAGAHNVIGALWEVSDVSTPRLMDELYRDLEKGQTPDTALRNAKLTLLKSTSYSKPFYWAPFQLYTGS